MMVMVSGADLLVIYLGLELMSLCLYVMAGFKRYEPRPLEAAAKYFILGSFSSGILLYGISLLFGRTGSTTLAGICEDRKSTRLNSSHVRISYAVFCLKKKKTAAAVDEDVGGHRTLCDHM